MRVEHVDVVVVGGGAAGLAAAVEAAGAGSRVVLLEKGDRLAGTTSWAVGSVSASRTSAQRRLGVQDSVEDHMEDMGAFAGPYAERDNLALRRVFAERSGETLDWLQDLGLVFLGPMLEPPHRTPRMYNVVPGSAAYLRRLRQVATRRGATIRLATRAVALVIEDGCVKGVDCEDRDGAIRFLAAGGVVLAAGDFSASTQLKAELIGPLAAKVRGINEGSTGDGIALGISAGSFVVNGDLALGPEIRFIPPRTLHPVRRVPPYRWLALLVRRAVDLLPEPIMRRIMMVFATTYLAPTARIYELGAVLVDRDGERFCDELDRPMDALPEQPDGVGWIVMDGGVAAQLDSPGNHISTAPGVAYAYLNDYRLSRRDLFHQAASIEQLAVSLGADPAALARSLGPEARPPFVALGPVRSWIVLTEGGLAVDEQCRVLDRERRPIPGLMAAGSNGQGGLILEGHGNHLGWAFTSGRIAGRTAVQRTGEGAAERKEGAR